MNALQATNSPERRLMMLRSNQWTRNGLPLGSDGILHNERIGSDEDAIMLYSLTNKHPVKRVSMERRQLVEVKNRTLVERQSHDSMPLTLFPNKAFERTRQRKSSKRMLDGEFPNGHRAK